MASFPDTFLCHLNPCVHVAGLGTASTEPSDELITNLRIALCPSSGQYQVWDPTRGSSTDYNVLLVETNARFPPRKGKSVNNVAHSPISPLTLASPLHPDGIIAPIWVRKHREMLPCVLILVLSLWEPAQDDTDPLEADSATQADAERVKDNELITQIIERKRDCTERGVKLAVILMASQKMLDNPALDYRLSIVRRQAGLDSRASLFVISPVSLADTQTFATSLRNELYEAVIDYYREHGRRVRRKKSRVPSSVASRPIASTATAQATGLPLTSQGWTIRYDYKLGAFAEFRQELEVALKHYEDCYNGLLDMFSAANHLVPRTKRWAEAKVLADCVNAKICKLYMYGDEATRVQAQHNRHLHRFRLLCEQWGMGVNTYEFWSWATKQYRLLADLTDMASKGGFRLPAPKITTQIINKTSTTQAFATGTSPATLLQHAGHHYYLAALCAMQRRDLFQQAEALNGDDAQSGTPALAHEKAVNHAEQILELLTKAYEQFKRHRATRTGLLIAYQIAITHSQGGNHAMALRFLERIAKSYRREHWRKLFTSVLENTHSCALITEAANSTFVAGFELLSPHALFSPERQKEIAQTLFTNLKAITADNSSDPIRIDLSDSLPIFRFEFSFEINETFLDAPAHFLLNISLLQVKIPQIQFEQIEIDFGTARVHIKHNNDVPEKAVLEVSAVDMQASEPVIQNGHLVWRPNEAKLLKGSIYSRLAVQVAPVRLICSTIIGQTRLELVYDFSKSTVSAPSRHRQINFTPRPIDATANLNALSQGYLDEHVTIEVVLCNKEVELAVEGTFTLSLKAQNSNDSVYDAQHDKVSPEPKVIEAIAPGHSRSLRFSLLAKDLPGDRAVELSVSFVSVAQDEAALSRAGKEISLRHIILIRSPFTSRFRPSFKRRRKLEGLQNLRYEGPDQWSNASWCELRADLGTAGIDGFNLLSMELTPSDEKRVRVVSCSLEDNSASTLLGPDSQLVVYWLLQILDLDRSPFEPGSLDIRWRRSHSASENATRLPLPAISIPFEPLCVLARYPATTRAAALTSLEFHIENSSKNKPITLAMSIETSEHWVLGCSRKITKMTILPLCSHIIRISSIPVNKIGRLEIPTIRVVEELPPLRTQPLEEGGEMMVLPQTRAVPVYAEGSTINEEDSDGQAQLYIYVLPI